MISIATSVFNAKLDFEQFVRQLHATSKAGSFEVLVAHDNRVEDGSAAALAALSREFPAVRVVATQTKAGALERVRATLASWEGKMDADLLSRMRAEADVYEAGKMAAGREFLWISPSPLLNLAAAEARGDFLLVTPCDRLLGFRMEDLEAWATGLLSEGNFYSRLPLLHLSVTNEAAERVTARWRKLTRQPGQRVVPPGLASALGSVREARPVHPGGPARRTATGFPTPRDLGVRRYDAFSPDLSAYRAVDPRDGSQVALSDADWVVKIRAIAESAESAKTIPINMAHHGLHLLTPKTWAAGGGYPTDLLGRTVAEDVLCTRLQPHFREQAPARFAFLEPRRHGLPANDPALRTRCAAVDADAAKHPIPWSSVERHLLSTHLLPRLIQFERGLYGV